MPIQKAGIAKAMMEQVSKLQKEQKAHTGAGDVSGEKFSELLNKPGKADKAIGASKVSVQNLDSVQQKNPVENVKKAVRLANISKTSNRLGKASKNRNLKTSFKSVLNMYSEDTRIMDKVQDLAFSGKHLNPTQLLVLQAGVHRASFELESMAKVVETGSNAFKDTMKTQV